MVKSRHSFFAPKGIDGTDIPHKVEKILQRKQAEAGKRKDEVLKGVHQAREVSEIQSRIAKISEDGWEIKSLRDDILKIGSTNKSMRKHMLVDFAPMRPLSS